MRRTGRLLVAAVVLAISAAAAAPARSAKMAGPEVVAPGETMVLRFGGFSPGQRISVLAQPAANVGGNGVGARIGTTRRTNGAGRVRLRVRFPRRFMRCAGVDDCTRQQWRPGSRVRLHASAITRSRENATLSVRIAAAGEGSGGERPSPASRRLRLSLRGVGPVKLGMTLADVREVTGQRPKCLRMGFGCDCRSISRGAPARPSPVWFLIGDGRVRFVWTNDDWFAKGVRYKARLQRLLRRFPDIKTAPGLHDNKVRYWKSPNGSGLWFSTFEGRVHGAGVGDAGIAEHAPFWPCAT